MLRPLIVGLGRSGAGLHLAALKKLRTPSGTARDAEEAPLFHWPPLAWDPRPTAASGLDDVTVLASLSEAARRTPPEETVVHLCTPPAARAGVLGRLAGLGYTRVLVEKPLACDPDQLQSVTRLRDEYRLDVAVVAHWLAAGLTQRLRDLIADRGLGRLLSVEVAQHKPRFDRTLATHGHPTAFDVEIPHSLGVVLDLAGAAELETAHCTDMHCGTTVVPHMGSAALTLRHAGGVRTDIVSDLTSPVQQRSVTLRFTEGTATAHYPISERDDHAQLILSGAVPAHHTFRDEALSPFLRRTYQRYAQGPADDFALHHAVARLLCQAKAHCRAGEEPPADPAPPTRADAPLTVEGDARAR
ncbi:hypothetical protein [Streptomyces diacarni]|uniref:hypothetical protein n=1 Tax=Streptomyces diacarni TaxID=2800381 RepID=UPI0015F0DB94|nr:hypothetical protein [Streptomyces diacarni]